jgi:hypothetical protein
MEWSGSNAAPRAPAMIASRAVGEEGLTLLATPGCAFKMAFMISARFLPAKGRWFVAIS